MCCYSSRVSFYHSQFCSLFFGSVLPASSRPTNQTMQSQEVLASDSEDERQSE